MLQTDKPQDIVDRCTAVIKRGPSKDDLVHDLWLRGLYYNKLGHRELTLADANHALELDPDNALVLSLRADVYLFMKMYPEARADCEHMLRLKTKEDVWAWALLGDLDRREKNPSKAVEDYTQVITMKPDAGWAYERRAKALTEDGKYALSILDDDQVLRFDPDNIEAAIDRSYDHLQRYEAGPAIDDANRVLRMKPDSVSGLRDRGRGYLLEGKFTEALSDLTQALELEPSSAPLWVAHGEVYFFQGKYDLALADYDHALSLAPDDVAPLVAKSAVALSRGEADAAIALADSVIQKRPKYGGGYRNRGLGEFMLQQWDKAAKDFAEAAKLSPERAYTALWQYLAVARGGGDGKPELLQELSAMTSADWPMQVGLFYAGKQNASTVLDAATSPESYRDKQLKCEAYFYLGEAALLASDKSAAADYFRKSLATGVMSFTEYQMANAELQSLGPAK